MSKANKFVKNDAGFTGLEAAIVLIAFVVVAAVFSYVMLGAGFFTSEKSKQVVHTGVTMATSSLQTSGGIIAAGDPAQSVVNNVTVTLQLTAGNNPIDLSKTIVSFQDKNQYVSTAWDGMSMTSDGVLDNATTGSIVWIHQLEPKNTLLEPTEMAQLSIPLENLDTSVTPNDQITLTVIPPQGATLPITVTIPPAIQNSMELF